MCRLVPIVAAVATVLFVACGGATAARLALVIGNDAYPDLGADRQLAKAVADARAVGDALEGLGFTVLRGDNLDRRRMVDRLFDLTRAIRPGDTVALFYAGHGVAVGGANYLLPVDTRPADIGEEARVRGMAIAEADILADIQERKAGVTLVILDACRDNPFARPGATRSAGATRGLARVPEAQGVFAIYSAGYGQSALDSLGPGDPAANSVFTRVLVPALREHRTHLADLMIDVRQKVADLAASVGHEQNPAYYDQTRGGRIYLAAPDHAPPPQAGDDLAAPPEPVVAPADRRGSVGRVWHTKEGTSGWWGTWTRRGTSDTFDAINFDPTSTSFDISTAQMTITDGAIAIVRRAPRVVCLYSGRLAADGRSATGTYGCNNINQEFPWSATITDTLPPAPANDWRGEVWSLVDPDGWRGTLKRRGVSDIFDAVFRHPKGGIDMAPVLVRIDGDAVTLLRDQEKGRCTYQGRRAADRRRLAGTMRCDWAGSRSFPWSAAILR
jgi:hypothetical protein